MTAQNGQGYEAYVFDLDGVLLDFSDDLSGYLETIEGIFAERGVEADDSDVVTFARYDELDPRKLREVCEKYGVSFEEAWRERERRAFEYQADHIDEGIRAPYSDIDAVRRVAEAYPSAVVSNNQHATVEYAADALGLDFDAVYGREPTVAGIERGKPSPYYVERALDDLETRDALYVGDSPTDVVAARRAGIDAAFVARSHAPEPDSLDGDREPTHVLENLRVLDGVDSSRLSD
ncbi:MAG: HAD-IA family hydrolase [Halobacteriales archaeon]|nr:HAD-IA family hydrolase [Halobacteriales archaeon]